MKGNNSRKKNLLQINTTPIDNSPKLVNLKTIQIASGTDNLIYKEEEPDQKQAEPVNEKNIISQINNNFHQYTLKEIPIHECLSSASYLTADLLNYHTDFKIAKHAYNESLLNISYYYTILHMDIYTGNGCVDKNFNYCQLIKLNHRTLDEITKNWRIPKEGLDQIKSMSNEVLKNHNDIYYNFGLNGCFNHLVQAVYSHISYPNNHPYLSKDKITDLISCVQAEKFFCTINYQI